MPKEKGKFFVDRFSLKRHDHKVLVLSAGIVFSTKVNKVCVCRAISIFNLLFFLFSKTDTDAITYVRGRSRCEADELFAGSQNDFSESANFYQTAININVH